MSSAPTFRPLLNAEAAAEYLDVHPKTVVRMAREQQLPALRIGKHWRFRVEDLTAWVAGQVQMITPARASDGD